MQEKIFIKKSKFPLEQSDMGSYCLFHIFQNPELLKFKS